MSELFDRLEALRIQTKGPLTKSEWRTLLHMKTDSAYSNLLKVKGIHPCWQSFLQVAEATPISKLVKMLKGKKD